MLYAAFTNTSVRRASDIVVGCVGVPVIGLAKFKPAKVGENEENVGVELKPDVVMVVDVMADPIVAKIRLGLLSDLPAWPTPIFTDRVTLAPEG